MILKKLLKLLQNAGVVKTEVQGDETQKTTENSKVFRSARVSVFPVYDVYFQAAIGNRGADVVVNVSTSGMGLLRVSGRFWPEPHAVVFGHVMLHGKHVAVQTKIVRATSSIIGCSFVGDTTLLAQALEEYFSVELSAVHLSEVNPEILKTELDGRGRLFRSKQNCELYLVERDAQLIRFQMSFLGNYLEGSYDEALKFGHVHGDEREKPKYEGSSLVRYVSDIPSEILTAAEKFVSNVPGLEKTHRHAIASLIAKARK